MAEQMSRARWTISEDDDEMLTLRVELWSGHAIVVAVWRDDATAPFVGLQTAAGKPRARRGGHAGSGPSGTLENTRGRRPLCAADAGQMAGLKNGLADRSDGACPEGKRHCRVRNRLAANTSYGTRSARNRQRLPKSDKTFFWRGCSCEGR